MRRRNFRFVRNGEFIENLASRLHRFPVGITAHDNADERLRHEILSDTCG